MNLEQVKKSSDKELNRKVAELCGWRCPEGCVGGVRRCCPDCGSWEHGQCDGVGSFSHTMPCNHYPDYVNDLNEMHEAEKTLKNGRQMNRVVAEDRVYLAVLESLACPKHIALATARQRAVAFVATKEKFS